MAGSWWQNVHVATTLQTLVVDEADLVLSFGYEDDLRRLLPHLPKVVQTSLMSATLSPVRGAARASGRAGGGGGHLPRLTFGMHASSGQCDETRCRTWSSCSGCCCTTRYSLGALPLARAIRESCPLRGRGESRGA